MTEKQNVTHKKTWVLNIKLNPESGPWKKVGIRVGAWYFAMENIPLQKSYQ